MKVFFLLGLFVLFLGCAWPKVKVAGDDYLLSPLPQESTITLPHSTGGSGSGSNGVKPVGFVPQK